MMCLEIGLVGESLVVRAGEISRPVSRHIYAFQTSCGDVCLNHQPRKRASMICVGDLPLHSRI